MSTSEKFKAELVPVAYIGQKKVKPDNVAESGTVWNGFGDVQNVSKEVALKLLQPKYADIWALHEDNPKTVKLAPKLPKPQKEPDPSEHETEPQLEKPEPLPLTPPKPIAPQVVHPDHTRIKLLNAMATLITAPGGLDPDGKPNLEKLGQIVGREVSEQEREDAWQLVLKATKK